MENLLSGFVTWEVLATMGGCMAMVVGLTQLVKHINFMEKVTPRLISYALAVIILMLGQYFTGSLTLDAAALTLFNAAIISLASNGGYDAAKRLLGGGAK